MNTPQLDRIKELEEMKNEFILNESIFETENPSWGEVADAQNETESRWNETKEGKELLSLLENNKRNFEHVITKFDDYAIFEILNEYTLVLATNWQTKDNSHNIVHYEFYVKNTLLFSGNDYFIPFHMDPLSIDTAMDLLSWFTLKEGDTDAEYFEKYTPEQLNFSRSGEADELSLLVFDYETYRDENIDFNILDYVKEI